VFYKVIGGAGRLGWCLEPRRCLLRESGLKATLADKPYHLIKMIYLIGATFI